AVSARASPRKSGSSRVARSTSRSCCSPPTRRSDTASAGSASTEESDRAAPARLVAENIVSKENGETPAGQGEGGRLREGPAPELMEASFARELADAPILHRGLGLADLAHVIALVESGV